MLFMFNNGLSRRASQIFTEQVLTESLALVDSSMAMTIPFMLIDRCVVEVPAGTGVYNAIGSSGDVVKLEDGKKYYNMIDLWRDLTGEPGKDCNNRYCIGDNNERIVGAHVVLEPSHTLRKGDVVYIVPLCNSCNTGIDSDEQIILDNNIKAVVLCWNGVTRK